MKKTKLSKGAKKPTALKKATKNSSKKSLARTDEPKAEKAKRAAFKRDQARIAELRTQIQELKAQRTRMRLEAKFANMIRDEIYALLNVAGDYLMCIHPDLTGKPVAEALKEVLIRSFHAVDSASLFTNAPEIRKESLAYFQRILERERKRSAAETRRAKKEANSHAFRSFCYDVILCALYLKKHGWKRHWLSERLFPGDFRTEKNKGDWQVYLRNLVSKCTEASPQDYPMPRPEIKGYASSRFHSQVEPAIREILALDEEELSQRMDHFVFWKLEFFGTKGRSPAWKVLEKMFPGCI